MRHVRILPAVLASAAAMGLAACGPEAEPPSIARCEIDLSAWTGSGSGASARVATQDDLLQGEAATGRPGDVVLENDRIRVLIEAAGRTLAPQPYGGNLIDAGLKGSGKPFDAFGELGALFQFGRTVNHELVEVVRDGKDGGAAVVAATGRDAILDFINLPGMIANYISGLELPEVDPELGLRITTWYVLPPDSNSVKIIQAFCNDGAADVTPLPVGDLVDSGGVVGYFTAVGNGFTGGGSISDLTGALNSNLPSETFVAWVNDDVAYGYMPDGDFASLVVAGVTSTLHGKAGLTDWLGTLDEDPDGAVTVPKGGKTLVSREFIVTRDVAGLYDHYYGARKVETGTVKGTVKGADGKAAAGVRVAALRGEGKDEKLLSLFTTDANGAFSGSVPVGSVRLVADSRVVRSEAVNVSVEKGKEATAELSLPAHATLKVAIRDGEGHAIPGKITVQCDGACPVPRTDSTAAYFHDVKTDSLPARTFEIAYVGPEGEASIDVAAGSYRVSISRGIEWSLDTHDVTVAGGETLDITGTLEHVVDTTGWVSADFHVHAINSPDSPVPNVERLTTFLAEGVDVIVSTDHDFITDMNPYLDLIPDARKYLKAVTGAEITTFDYGHYNAFPLVADPNSRNGGAIDWAREGNAMAPADIFEAAHAFPGEQVVQLNHARSGFFGALRMDTRTLWTREPTKVHRIRKVEPEDPNSGDTGLFDDRFTALEIMNGTNRDNFNTLLNDWFSLLSRGFTKTATAVSDTHKRHGDSGHPRSFVQLGLDTPSEIDDEALALAVNAGKVIGTNGPFVLATARVGSGDPVGIGGTLKSNGGTVTVDVEVRTPHWMTMTQAHVFANTPGTESDGMISSGNAKFPTAEAKATLEEAAPTGGKARTYTASVELELERDAWIVVVVEGSGDLFPVVAKGGTPPLAYTNAIYVDVDGNGWIPPVDLAEERKRVGKITPRELPLTRKPTELELRELLRGCHQEHSHAHD